MNLELDRGLRQLRLSGMAAVHQTRLRRTRIGEAVAVIRIGIATGNPEHPLRDEIAERMRHTIEVAGVGQTATQSRRQCRR